MWYKTMLIRQALDIIESYIVNTAYMSDNICVG